MADGSPEVGRTEDRYTVLEARISSEWQRIASCGEPEFRDGYILLDRVVLTRYPEFTLNPPPIERWLARKMLAVTNITKTPTRQSTSSWVCLYDGCESISEISAEGDIHLLLNARFLL